MALTSEALRLPPGRGVLWRRAVGTAACVLEPSLQAKGGPVTPSREQPWKREFAAISAQRPILPVKPAPSQDLPKRQTIRKCSWFRCGFARSQPFLAGFPAATPRIGDAFALEASKPRCRRGSRQREVLGPSLPRSMSTIPHTPGMRATSCSVQPSAESVYPAYTGKRPSSFAIRPLGSHKGATRECEHPLPAVARRQGVYERRRDHSALPEVLS